MLNEVGFKVVCEAVAEAAYLAEVREERKAATPTLTRIKAVAQCVMYQ